VTPGLEFTRSGAAAGGTGGQAVDLGEIRRSGEAINALAARGAAGAELRHDPALVLLGALVADVDTPSTRAEPGVEAHGDGRDSGGLDSGGLDSDGRHGDGRHGDGLAAPAWPGRAATQRAAARHALAGPQSRGAAAWLRAAVAGGVVAGLASVTSLIATSMLARLARGPARGSRWEQRPARSRRVR
jgi:hypothetical protein